MSELDRRQVLKYLAALGATSAVPSLAACGDSAGNNGGVNNAGPVRIGMLAPQSGIYEVIGEDLIKGFELYLQLHDNKLGGRDVTLIKADEGETADSGKPAAERLIKNEDVLALTGVVNSNVMLAIKDLVETSRVPLIGSNASPTTLQGAKYIWRTSYVNDEPGKALGRYLAENLPGKGPLYLIAADYQAGKDEINGLLDTFRQSDGVVWGQPVYTPFVPPTKNFAPYLSAIKNSNAKAVFCFYAGSSAVDFVKQYQAAKIELPLYAPGFLTEGQVLQSQADAAQGIYTAMNYAIDLDNAANRAFAAEFQKNNDRGPTTYAMASYDAAAVLDKAIALAGRDLDRISLNLALGQVGQIDSPRGAWQFNQTRTPQQKWYLRQVRMDGTVLSNTLVSELTTLG
ncbi:MAG TPA: ABC transporter substrate-binding protein [Micromonosporaceae bacterium]|nr:ABC transporter substrate-binding protein [Micromonosporaceae bacterium]